MWYIHVKYKSGIHRTYNNQSLINRLMQNPKVQSIYIYTDKGFHSRWIAPKTILGNHPTRFNEGD